MNRTILLFDIEKFGRRDDVQQAFMRRKLHTIVEQSLTAAGANPHAQHREDRGDAVMVLVTPDISKVSLLRVLLKETDDLLRSDNRLTADSAQVRLRVVLAAGEVALDPQPGTLGGAVGHDLNQAFRLLDAEELKTALKRNDRPTAVCVSASVHQSVVRHGYAGVNPEEFREITVQGKEGPLTAWLHSVNEPPSLGASTAAVPPPGTAAPSRAPIRAPGTPRGAFVGGNLVMGNQYGVTGGQVSGDVVMGSKNEGDPR
ncbi:hypothetical protein DEH69_26010 [Streptomyces sp. PT12]|nr:hypothetical protein DEH69_26010 [Streptomyces sp. PT12]